MSIDSNNQGTRKLNTDEVHFSTSNVFPDTNASPEDNRITGKLLLAVFAAVCGTAFPFGYASGVINAPQDNIESFINETKYRRDPNADVTKESLTFIMSWIVSIFALGGMIGGLFGGFVTDRLGRKGGMLANNIISILACILMFISKPIHSYEVLLVGRFFVGLACGYGSSVAPTYINEVSPRSLRGTFGASFQLGLVIVLFASQIITLQSILGGPDTWHYALGLAIVFSVLQVVLLFLVPESPKHILIKRNDPEGAEKALQWLRGHTGVHHEITEMQEEKNQQQQAAKISDLFKTPIVRWALLIAVVTQLSQQFSGINGVIYYSTTIFLHAGFSQTTAEYFNLAIGATNIIITIVSVFLMDRLGRRILHLTGLGGMFVTVNILAISLLVGSSEAGSYISVLMTILFVALFAVGPGSIPWLITAELFNQAFRVPASSIAVMVNWTANFIVGVSFKSIFENVLHESTFFLFAGLLVLFFLFTFFFVPETKAKSVETIYAEINAGQVWRSRRANLLYTENRDGQINNYGSTVDYGVLPSA